MLLLLLLFTMCIIITTTSITNITYITTVINIITIINTISLVTRDLREGALAKGARRGGSAKRASCVYIYIYIERERDTYIYIYIYIYIYMYVYIYIYIYIYLFVYNGKMGFGARNIKHGNLMSILFDAFRDVCLLQHPFCSRVAYYTWYGIRTDSLCSYVWPPGG